MSQALKNWTWQRSVKLGFTQTGRPTDNSYIESFDGKLWDELVSTIQFVNLGDAKSRVEAWRIDYSEARPHGSLGKMNPREYADVRHEGPPKTLPTPCASHGAFPSEPVKC